MSYRTKLIMFFIGTLIFSIGVMGFVLDIAFQGIG
ncbi:uncharacterized protein METZ01_LOCUS88058 [marine metagenome]|uniref:Uncharacterized protein n=1 Tax=marine metagenome TaxID=408172 RepID=A0A381V4S9_9ZZZZ